MSLLFVDACPRSRDTSRTYTLALAFLDAFGAAYPKESIETLRLASLAIKPYDGEMVDLRERLIDEGLTDDGLFDLSHAFCAADAILIAAPYWDFSFPSMLKVYIEHVFARTIAFTYEHDQPVGLCRARRMAYLTTAGSPIGERNFGGDYLRGIARVLGIERFDQVSGEGLDVEGADVRRILLEAEKQARTLASSFLE